MNKKIFENSRFTPKGDIEANWNKAVGFVPLDKEIIIYKADANHSAARFKVGDGKTVVQDLPFSGTDIEAIEKLIDEKGELLIEYVDNAVAAINPQIQPDYNQNDNTAADYIKNRPFYETDSLITSWTENTELDQIDITATIFNTKEKILSYRKVSEADIQSVDDFYSLKLNNDNIDSTKINDKGDYFGYITLTGKVKILTFSPNATVPYLIIVQKDNCNIGGCISLDSAVSLKLGTNKNANKGIYILQNANSFANFNEYDSASLYGKLVVPIDMKYLPSDIITKTDVELLEQKNDEQDTKIAAIENKIITATKDNILSIFN